MEKKKKKRAITLNIYCIFVHSPWLGFMYKAWRLYGGTGESCTAAHYRTCKKMKVKIFPIEYCFSLLHQIR